MKSWMIIGFAFSVLLGSCSLDEEVDKDQEKLRKQLHEVLDPKLPVANDTVSVKTETTDSVPSDSLQ